MEGFQVESMTFDASNKKKATGVVGRWTSRDAGGGVSGPLSQRTSRQVVVKAKKVILSAGSLWSPLILMKSGLHVSTFSLYPTHHVMIGY
jgi:choline dehydrogenase-like flavoprotein